MIHPTAIIDWDTVTIGNNVDVGAYSVISHCEIDDDSKINSHVVIGQPAEHSFRKFEFGENPKGIIKIGKRVVVREFSTITLPTAGLTNIMDDVYIMGRCHIAHDCIVESYAILSIGSVLAGWTRIMEGANVGVAAVTHQFSTVGPYAMIAGNAMVVKDVPPLAKYIPGKKLTINVYAIQKWKLPLEGEAFITQSELYVDLKNKWEAKRHKERAVYQYAEGL